MIRGMLAFICRVGGRISILTRNLGYIVDSWLRLAGLSGYVSQVLGKESGLTNKGAGLVQLIHESRIGTRWVFVDNDPGNVKAVVNAASEEGAHVDTVLVQGGCGMQHSHVDQLKNFVIPAGSMRGGGVALSPVHQALKAGARSPGRVKSGSSSFGTDEGAV
eukprot:Hpha_TRINITY_DN7456_c0_g1::TRINITY_DN7456_c0_g1_i1::g.95813::m.95813